VARAAGVIRSSAHQALEDLRAVIGVLRDDPDGGEPERPQPTLADLPALIDESRDAGMRVAHDWRVPTEAAVPEALGRNAYRIVQEGLTNARKHARGSTVDVTVDGAPGDGLAIEIRNRLPVGAFAGAQIPGAGTGIVGLTERASLAGGRLEHGRTEAGDYRLWAWLPWPA
jgi:signal transduction histidine kinase